ncbi:hypothetical protein FSP39_011927 [Pinctada imbricata]|uniref:G-protein coupled receptors family 1 profile domain-containing protein n=1 Tax=Pinctada imbricata TaxID=66713 RepID=A0AA89BR26_PINIB|nr:hypothetical protein FSP39_011927 [Pinctada imbricata]
MSTYSDELHDLNDRAVKALIPAIIYVVILMIIGLIGNPLVIYFYGCKQKPTPSYYFIVTLAIFDSITCSLSMPLEIVDLVRFYTFESSEACKLLRFINYFASIASGFTLIAIAVDRYRKICRPFETQISLHLCKIIIVFLVIASLFFSWPAAVFFKVVEVNVTESVTVIGYDCTTVRDDEFKTYITVYNIILFVMFAGAITVLIVLYSLVARKIFTLKSFKFYAQKRQSHRRKARPQTSTTNNTEDTAGFSSYSDSLTTATEIQTGLSDIGENDFPLLTIPETSPTPSVAATFSSRKIVPFDTEKRDINSAVPISNSTLNLQRYDSFDESILKENMASIVNRSNSANIEKLKSHQMQLKQNRNAMNSRLKSVNESENTQSTDVTPNGKETFTRQSITRDSNGRVNIDQKKLQAQNINTRKYTIVMLSISVAFIISFLPYLGLITWRTLSKDYEPNLFSESELVAFQIGLRSFLLSSACNPLIYGFLNTEFQSFVLSIFCCCKKKSKEKSSEIST